MSSVRRRSGLERLEDRQLLTSSNGYLQIALAADQSGSALLQDANLQNASGIATSPGGGPVWAVDSGSGVATRYLGDVSGSPFTADPPAISIPGSSPTAIAFNPTGDFVVGTGQNAVRALFLFASQDGTISGWSGAPTLSSPAQTATTVSGAEFTGLAVAVNGTSSQLYAADFHNAKVDVFNGTFGAVTLPAGAFTDPNLPAGYAPYNIELIAGKLYVTYGLQNAGKTAPQTGAGDGLIDVYNLDGSFANRLVSNGGQLNAPWGLAVAPSSTFGDFAGDLLVANTGDGHILAYDPGSGSFLGMLNNGPGTTQPITISNLHGLAFGNGATGGAGDTSTLFYTAGNGQHGQLGAVVNAFDRPLVVVPTSVTASEGATFSGTLATFSDSNTTLTASSFTALVNWGDNTTQTTATVTANSNGGFNITTSHLYTEDVGIGPIQITVSDGTHNASATSRATVSETDFTATATSISATEGHTFSGSVATFNDADDAGNASKFVASINWGDGSSATTTSVTATGSSGFSVASTHTYADEGTFTITTTILEIGGTTSAPTSGAIGVITSSAVVAEADSFTGTATSISATEGSTFTGNLATFTDSDTTTPAGDLTATINWGDGTTDTVAVSGGSGSFTVPGSHVYGDEGTISGVTVTLSEKSPGTASASATTTATVAESDSFTGTAQTVTASQAATVSGGTVATFTDSNHATTASQLAATINWGDGTTTTSGTVSGSAGNFSVTGNHTYANSGTFPMTVTIAETTPGTASATVTTSSAVVLDTDFTATAATVTSPTEGAALATTTSLGTFTDADGSTLASAYSATIDWGDGTSATTGSVSADGSGGFSVTGGHTYADEGTFTATVMVSETGTPATLAGIFANTISVADADTTLTGTGASLTATEQSSFTGQLATFTDTNTGANPADFTAVINWGDGTSATTAAVTGSSGLLTVTGSHTYADEGTFSPVVTLSDPGGSTASVSATVAVADADALTASPGTISVSEGASFSGNVATFTDTDTTTPATDFTVTIDWGDSTSVTTTTASGSAGNFTVAGTHTYAEDGSYAVHVTIADQATGAATASATFTATVAEANLSGTADSITSTEGQTFSGTVATFTDTGSPDTGANYTATIAWGDGNTSTGSVSSVGGHLVVSGSHAYSDEGIFATTVQLTETNVTATATAGGTATVADADVLAATAVSAAATEGKTFTGNVATFTDTDLSTPASDFTATIVWGDGNTSSGTVTGTAGNFVVQGSNVYADEGSFSAVVTIHDKQGTASATATAAATVAEADVLTGTATPITATNGTTFSGTVATFTDSNAAVSANDFAANIDWGDGSTGTGNVSLASGTLTVSGSHVYTQTGPETVKVTLSDNTPGTATATATATATVSAASLSATGVPVNVTEGTTVSNATVATFTDSSGNQPVSNYSATIDWGDGTTSTGTIAANSGGSGFTVAGSHSYFSPGNKTLKITISATGGVSTQAVTTATIGSKTERFVAQVYRDLLKREAEPQGEQYWTNLINSGHTRAEETLNIERSIEYRTDVVNDIFELYLHRPADSTALNLSTQLLLVSTPEQLSEIVVSSPEYYQTRGGSTNQGFLNALYSDALNRPVDSAALAAMSNDNFSNIAARQQVAVAVFGGNEFLSDLVSSPNARPTNSFGGQPTIGWYQAYLHRNAGSSEVSQDVSSLHSGSTDPQMVAIIIGSDEYFAQFGQ